MDWIIKRLIWLRNRLGIPAEISWDIALDQFFDRLAFMQQPGEQKQLISMRIVEDAKTGWLYWLELTLSVLIATFGLLQNSVAVIIGAMLIAPFLRPIQGVAFAIANGRRNLLWQTVQTLLLSTIYAVGLAWLVLFFVPYFEITPEILSRTAPNLFDLLIAILSAMVASLAHVYKRLYESVAGVAMATAIVPPLAVMGILIYTGDLALAWGSFVLFLTNLVAILLVGVILFIFCGFNPHRQNSESSAKGIVMLLMMTFVLWFTLSAGLKRIEENRTLERNTYESLVMTIEENLPGARLNDFVINKGETGYVINGELFIAESARITRSKLNMIKEKISQNIGEDFELQLDIVRTVSVDGEE